MRTQGLLGAACLTVALMTVPTPSLPQSGSRDIQSEVTQAEAEEAARSVARFCKILVTRMDELIVDSWASQELQDLASVWDSLDCHQVFGVDERLRWLTR